MTEMKDCGICLSPIENNSFLLYCGHEFHGKCMFRYSDIYLKEYHENPSVRIPCPNCRNKSMLLFHSLETIITNDELDDLKEIINENNVNKYLSNWGITPLHIAAYKNKLDAVKYLLEIGANINSKAKMGHTPLYSASLSGNFEIVKYLVENGADTNIIHSTGKKAIDVAFDSEHIEIFIYLSKI
jgi:ankyrin repeat protein